MSLPTKQDLENQMRQLVLQQQAEPGSVTREEFEALWRAYRNQEYRLETPVSTGEPLADELTTYVINAETTDCADGGQDQVDITNSNEWKHPFHFRILQVILWIRYKAEPFLTYKQCVHFRIWEKDRLVSSTEALHYHFYATRAYYHSTEWRGYHVLPDWKPFLLHDGHTLRVDYMNFSGATLETVTVWLGGQQVGV